MAIRYTRDVEEVFRRRERFHGVPRPVASARLHALKSAANLPADFDLEFDFTGTVFGPGRHRIGSSMSVPVWLLIRIDNELASLYCDGTKRENPAATLVSAKKVFAEKAVAEAALARLSRDFPDRQYVLLSGRAEQEITGRGNLFGRLSLERFSPGCAIDPRDISVSDLAGQESQVPPATGEAWSAIVSARYREPAPAG